MKKLVLTSFNRQLSGITSILVVIAVGMVLSIMVAGIATLSIRELRQASNTEQSKKAFQGAESAVNFAAQKLADDSNYTVDACPLKTSTDAKAPDFQNLFGSGSQQEVTCVKVGNTFNGYYEGHLQADRAVQFYAGPDFGITEGATPWLMSLDWHDKTNNGVLTQYITTKFYPTVYTDRAAALEISFIYWSGSTINVNQPPTFKTFFITPGNPDKGFTVAPPAEPLESSCEDSLSTATTGWDKVPAPKDGYACGMERSESTGGSVSTNTDLGFRLRQVLTNVGATANFIIRIKPRYRDTNIKFGLFDYVTDPLTNKQKSIPFRSAQTQVDVTAKSANIYRRVKASIPSRSMALDNVFDSAIYSGAGDTNSETINICKNLNILIDPSSIDTINNVFKYVPPPPSGSTVCGQPWQGP